MEYIVLVISILIIISIFVTKLSDNLGIPSLVLFMLVGMLAGSDGLGKINFEDVGIARAIGIISLVLILFAGSLSIKWRDMKQVLNYSISLSTVGVIITTILTGLFVHFVFGFDWRYGLLLGAMVSSTDAAAVFSVLRAKDIRLKPTVRSTLEVESCSNDPLAVFLTILFIELIQIPDLSLLSIIWDLANDFSLGLILGLAFGWLMLFVINKINLPYDELYPIFAIVFSLLIYSAVTIIGGSGFFAVFIASAYLGNHEFVQKKSLTRFFESLAQMGEILMFLTLGLLVFPSQLAGIIVPGLIISAVLIFLFRPIGVFISLIVSKFSVKDKLFISWVGLRGAVPIVLATFPLTAGIAEANTLFNLVFFIVLTSVLIQGWSIPLAAKIFKVFDTSKESPKIGMEIKSSLKTNKELIDFIVPHNSGIVDKSLAELNLPEETLITFVSRDDEYFVPNGSTKLKEGDTLLILSDKDKIKELISVLNQKA